jgi:ATP-dependent protease ClpP protease subunit
MVDMRELSKKLPKSTPIYLVMDTPGGSIFEGMHFIDFAKALPQKVHTVTLFSASMGFQIVQNLDTRYITRTGILMSHRATVSGLGGQLKGEFESRYKMLRRSVDYLDFVAAKRMGISTKDYEAMVLNEYWVYGYDAVAAKAADEEVLVKCGDSMNGDEELKIGTIFGTVKLTFSKCSLIRTPSKIDVSDITDPENRAKVERALFLMFQDPERFIKQYMAEPQLFSIFK